MGGVFYRPESKENSIVMKPIGHVKCEVVNRKDTAWGDNTAAIVLDYIHQVQIILNRFNIEAKCEDYPLELQEFMGRRIWRDNINSINSNPEKWGVFVKPVKEKAFTGLVDIRPYNAENKT